MWFPVFSNLLENIQDPDRTADTVDNQSHRGMRFAPKNQRTFAFDSLFSWGVTMPLAITLCFLTDLPVLAVYAIVQAADIIKIVIGAVMIRKGIWIKNLTR